MLADSAQTLVNIYGSDVTNYLSARGESGFHRDPVRSSRDVICQDDLSLRRDVGKRRGLRLQHDGAITSGYATNPAYWTLWTATSARSTRSA